MSAETTNPAPWSIADAPFVANWKFSTPRDAGWTELCWLTEDGQYGATRWTPAQLEEFRRDLNHLRYSKPQLFGK